MSDLENGAPEIPENGAPALTDTERLDWIENERLVLNCYLVPPGRVGWQCIRFRQDGTRHVVDVDYDDVRRAIDMAVHQINFTPPKEMT